MGVQKALFLIESQMGTKQPALKVKLLIQGSALPRSNKVYDFFLCFCREFSERLTL